MVPYKIQKTFIQLETDFSGIITKINAGVFILTELNLKDSIYKKCPFLEATLDAITCEESFKMDGMFISTPLEDYTVDVEISKHKHLISILIINRSNVYDYVKQLNQNRNEISIVQNKIARQNDELTKLRKIADKANEEKSRFLAIMSHEIRNPLNSILGFGNMIASETTNAIIKDYSKYLLIAAKSLKVIVTDILDLSRVEAGKLELAAEPMSIKEVVKNCIEDFRFQHNDSEITLNYLLSDALPKQVLGDSVRINQILSNLISNAFKFTNKGKIEVKVDVVLEETKIINIRFSVKDTGRGISSENIKKLFKEYEQTELDDNRILGGAGLGLSIVKKLTEAMGGKTAVKSKLNKGTTFSLSIPFQKANHAKNNYLKEIPFIKNNINLEGIELLLADDDMLNQVIASHILSKEGVNSTIVNDGLEALLTLKEKHFDVILLDINMPNLTGEEVLLKKPNYTEYNHKTPILAITANVSKDEKEKYLNQGFACVISKPFTSDDLLNAIRFALNKS